MLNKTKVMTKRHVWEFRFYSSLVFSPNVLNGFSGCCG